LTTFAKPNGYLVKNATISIQLPYAMSQALKSQLHPDLDELDSCEEIFDAMAVLSILATKEFRRDKYSDVAFHLIQVSEKLQNQLDVDQWKTQMKAIGAKTSFDIRFHAERLLQPEFRD